MDLERALGPSGPIAKQMAGYEFRPQQIEVAVAIERALASKQHCLAEAGTGVGKSMAYLLPAIDYSLTGKKVIISTHTIYLQSQLLNKDIPFLQSVFPGKKFRALVAKGRGNYLCLNNFDAELGQLSLIGDPNLHRVQKWASHTETGDVAELDFQFSGWSDICSNQDTCHNQQCRHFGRCFYYKMRREAQDADIVVTNHSLFFADLGIRTSDPNAGVLPDYEAVIFDEAHHLEDIATKAFGVECASFRVPNLLKRIRRVKGIGLDATRLQTLEELNSALFGMFSDSPKQEFFLHEVCRGNSKSELEETVKVVCSMLDGLNRELTDQNTEGQPELEERLSGLRRMTARVKEEMTTLFFGTEEGFFKWGERSNGGGPRTSSRSSSFCFLRYSPLSVADILRQHLWKEIDSVVLTSATLSNSGTFSYIRGRLGVPECVETAQDSPFNFETQCMLYIPRHLDFPSENPVYTDAVAREIEQLVGASGGRAFLLFTSYRMMNAVYEALFGRLPYTMMKQGDMSNEALVQEFLAQEQACLFGVHSFWEGVDIRGEALSIVVIDKLPFAVPDSPVNKARTDAITASGGDWFRDFSMPQAQIRLKQGFGRLIRTKTDHGVVAILDSRLIKKMYGREFIRFLPQCPVTVRMDDVQRFFGRNE